MANGDKLTLEVVIKTTLEGAGFKPTEEEVKAVAQQIREATAASDQLTTSAEDLAKRLDNVRASANTTATEVKGIGESAKEVTPAAQSVDEMAKAFAAANAKAAEFGNTTGKLSSEQLEALERKLRADIAAAEALGQSTDSLQAKLSATTAALEKFAAIEPPAGVAQSVDEMAEAFANANGGVETLGKTSNEVLLELEEKLRADIKATQELGENTDALKAKLDETYRLRTSGLEDSIAAIGRDSQSAIPSVAQLTRGLSDIKNAGQGATQALNGLSQGGIVGLVNAARGSFTVIRTLTAGALGAPFLAVLAGAGAGLIALNRSFEANKAQIKKWYDEARARSDGVKIALAEIDAAAAKSLDAQNAKVQQLTQSYGELTTGIAASRAATDALGAAETARRLAEIDAREAEALEFADTPEAVAGVQKKFAADRQLVRNVDTDRQITDQKSGAEIEKIGAQNAIKDAQAIIDAARLAADEAAAAFRDAADQVKQFRASGGDLTSTFGKSLVDDGKKALRASEKADANLDAVLKEKTALIASAEATQKAAALAIELADLARQKFDAEKRATAATQRLADAKEREARIAEQVANGVDRRVAEGREKPNQGGTVVTPKGSFKVDPGAQPTPQEKAGDEAIEKSRAPTPAVVTPEPFRIPDPLPTINQPKPAPLGATPPAPAPVVGAAPSSGALGPQPAAAQPAVIGAEQVTQAVSDAPKPEPVDLQPLATAFTGHAQQTAQTLGKINGDLGALAKVIDDHTRAIAALSNRQQSLAEASQT